MVRFTLLTGQRILETGRFGRDHAIQEFVTNDHKLVYKKLSVMLNLIDLKVVSISVLLGVLTEKLFCFKIRRC